MDANKVTLKINCEVLDVASLEGLLEAVCNQLNAEVASGKLVYNDGDEVSWDVSLEPVSF